MIISSPSIFDFVSGRIQVEGTATGDGFEFYRLQVGQGLNPSAWLQLDQDVTAPVVEGEAPPEEPEESEAKEGDE